MIFLQRGVIFYERLLLLLKQKDEKIVELEGIIRNLQYYFTDQKVLFKNPKDPENAVLRPKDLDNLPHPKSHPRSKTYRVYGNPFLV